MIVIATAPGKARSNSVLRVARPVTADLHVIRVQCRAVTGVIDQQGNVLPRFARDFQHREIVIHRPVGDATIYGKTDTCFSPGESRWFTILQRGESHLLKFVDKLRGVSIDVRLVFRRDIFTEYAVEIAGQLGSRMRVRHADREFVRSDPFLRQPFQQRFANVVGKPQLSAEIKMAGPSASVPIANALAKIG